MPYTMLRGFIASVSPSATHKKLSMCSPYEPYLPSTLPLKRAIKIVKDDHMILPANFHEEPCYYVEA